ncbi:protein of unknown function [Methylacidimicrobium sp. AP8]|nr:protein of unknown function [Methylacidimicrobium sp. AP8]
MSVDERVGGSSIVGWILRLPLQWASVFRTPGCGGRKEGAARPS